MVRPLKNEMLGPRKLQRVPEGVQELESLYEVFNSLYTKGVKPRSIIRELERLLTELDRLAVRDDPCEVLSGFCNQLNDIEL